MLCEYEARIVPKEDPRGVTEQTTIEVGLFASGGAKRQNPSPIFKGRKIMSYAVQKTDRSFAFAYTRFDELPQKVRGK
jgi:hypothetical protein